MSKRKSNAVTVGASDGTCPACGYDMVVRKHAEITEKMRKQYFCFTQWDYCKRCNKVFFDEKYKKNLPLGVQWEERQQQVSFLKSI